jgi:large subunit ribosomal protein L5
MVAEDLSKIAGQRPVKNLSRKSISGFKVRQNQIVGLSTTLRGYRMYSFIDKLVNIALPRVRDFQGISKKGFDGRGNYHLGLKEQIVFPEVPADSLENLFGLEISVVTNAGKNEPVYELLKLLGFPFKD